MFFVPLGCGRGTRTPVLVDAANEGTVRFAGLSGSGFRSVSTNMSSRPGCDLP